MQNKRYHSSLIIASVLILLTTMVVTAPVFVGVRNISAHIVAGSSKSANNVWGPHIIAFNFQGVLMRPCPATEGGHGPPG